jgi:hypothetical protein
VNKLKRKTAILNLLNAIFTGTYLTTPGRRTAVNFVVGSWCIALILGFAYNSLLISYILVSNSKAMVDSLTELTKNPNVQLVEKGRVIEIFLLVLKNIYECIYIATYFNMLLSHRSAKVVLTAWR